MSTLSFQWRTPNVGRFGALLVALTATFLVAPFVADEADGISEISILYTLVMVAGIYTVSRRRRVFWVGLGLATLAIGFEWASNFIVNTPLILANMALVGLFVMYVAIVVFYEVLDEDRVTIDTISGGIAIYLLIGIGWVLIYASIEYTQPGSFLLRDQTLHELHPTLQVRFPEFLYFSFVTMTTLGFGDMVPTTPPARAMTAAEAIVGQLYIAVFVARLVGLHLVHSRLALDDDRERPR